MSIRSASALALALTLTTLVACGTDGDAPSDDLIRDEATRRTSALGEVIGGRTAAGAHAWRGLPFAAPPTGPLRWKAPAPAAHHDGVREALTHAPPCPQFATFAGGPDDVGPGEAYGDEDCLYLNVFAPPFAADAVPATDARLPVMVWIHGGGNSLGSASTYDGSVLATRGDVIVVAVQYRLGPLGWFRHESLREGASGLDASGNFGTLDLVESLRWVQGNIAAFGGDPGNVTVFGESAGGTNTYTMLVSPQAEGLFHRAIVQSGTPRFAAPEAGEDPAADPWNSRNTSSEVVARLRESGEIPADAPLADALRSLSPETVLHAYAGERGLGMINMPEVFADGVVLPVEDVYEALAAGRYNQVPTILGSNRDESKLFQLFNPDHVVSVMGIPLWVRNWKVYDRESEYSTKWVKLAGVDEPARRMAGAQGQSVYAYRFDWDEEPSVGWLDFSRLLGAAHAFEIPFVFGDFDFGPISALGFTEENAPGRLRLSEQMISYWTEFARSGSPGEGRDGSLPAWTAWDDSRPTAGRFIVFDTEAGGGVRMTADALTQAALVDQVIADPRFSDSAERCTLLAEVRRRRGQVSDKDLRRAGCDA